MMVFQGFPGTPQVEVTTPVGNILVQLPPYYIQFAAIGYSIKGYRIQETGLEGCKCKDTGFKD